MTIAQLTIRQLYQPKRWEASHGYHCKNNVDPCTGAVMTRREKLAKWEAIYAKCMDVIDKNLGIDKDSVYAACTAITTASREIVTVENVMRNLGELEVESTKTADCIGWGTLTNDQYESSADA